MLVKFTTLAAGAASTDVLALPGVSLHVAGHASPTPFLPPGPFRAEFAGLIVAEMRSEYRFQAELSGELRLEINGVEVLRFRSGGGSSGPSGSVRLNKGTNVLSATFTSAPVGDSYVRLWWSPRGGFPVPLPPQALLHLPGNGPFAAAEERRLGRALYLEYRCYRCHDPGVPEAAGSELNQDAPSFEDLGARRDRAWIADWVRDPKSWRPGARMPRLLHQDGSEPAAAMAAFLSTQRRPRPVGAGPLLPAHVPSSGAPSQVQADSIETGRRLFNNLHCEACHDTPGGSESDPERISLRSVRRKFPGGSLAEFLKKPEADYAWIWMPNFQLTDGEARQLADYLTANADPVLAPLSAPSPETVARGKQLVQSTGCLNCHASALENRFKTKSWAEITAGHADGGCLASIPAAGSSAPIFGLSAKERTALQRFAAAGPASLSVRAPVEWAQRQVRNLKCAACHGQFEGFPGLDLMGGKLKPEWTRDLLAGVLPNRPRPWLDARMPAFPAYASGLSAGLAMAQGYPAHTPPEPPPDAAAAQIGQRLVSAEGGLACIACHAVGKVSATQVFENAGVNLAYARDRLLKPYFERWLRNPLAIDPVSRMPTFFDDNLRSVLLDVYEGDGGKQIEAIWHYLQLGEKMPPPFGTVSP